jgi:hypothetical protein
VAYNAIDMESIPGSPEEFIGNSNKFSGILNARLILGANSTYFQTFHNEDKEQIYPGGLSPLEKF